MLHSTHSLICHDNRILCIERGAVDGVPRATWLDIDEKPMQPLSHWYGFSFTYPHCEIYEPIGL